MNPYSEYVFLRRSPIVDKERTKEYDLQDLEKKWLRVTELVKKSIIENKQVREEFVQFTTSVVSQELPNQMMDVLFNSFPELFSHIPKELLDFLRLPSVPEEQMVPDVRSAKDLISEEELTSVIENTKMMYGEDSTDFIEEMKGISQDPFLSGITSFEREVVFLKYKCARDIKLLALQAEMISVNNAPADSFEVFCLPSGVELYGAGHDFYSVVAHPDKWEKRAQLKDRIYRIWVHGKTYILKERKTSRHRDTQSRGHFDGLSSYDECLVGREMVQKASFQSEDFDVVWENPVGSVSFPDGFSFAVFGDMSDLLDKDRAEDIFIKKILEKNDAFSVKKEACEKEVGCSIPTHVFARVYAHAVMTVGSLIAYERMTACGYRDQEIQSGFQYKIVESGGYPKIQLCGFDYEYYMTLSEKDKQRKQSFYRSYIDRLRSDIGISSWSDRTTVSDLEKQVHVAVMKQLSFY